MHTTEDRLAVLIASGISVSLDISTSGAEPRVRFAFREGDVAYPGGRSNGFVITGEDTGRAGVDRFRSALAAAEAYVGRSLPVHLPPEFTDALNGPARDVLGAQDPMRLAQRASYIGSDRHAADETARQAEAVTA